MRKALMATSALAFAGAIAAAPASAEDMLSVGVKGYMQQWFGVANRDDDGADGGWAAHSDSEIWFRGALEADNGLKFTVDIELEGDRGANAIDESFARVSGEFGQVEFGARDHAMVRMHYGISDVGVGLNAGDTQKWIPGGTYLETSGHAIGNSRKLNYISPRVSGLQVGVSYAPDDTTQAPSSSPSGNDTAGWGAAINFQEAVGDMAVSFSLGHKSTDSAGAKVEFMPGMQAADEVTGRGTRITPLEHAAHKAAWEEFEYLDQNVAKNKVTAIANGGLETIAQAGVAGRTAIMGATNSVTKGDPATYTNAGVGVGFGAFKFNVAYARSEGGAYTKMNANVPITAAEAAATDGFTYEAATGTITETGHTVDTTDDGVANPLPESATNNDTANDVWMASRVVEDETKNADVWGVSVTYTDGPMAL